MGELSRADELAKNSLDTIAKAVLAEKCILFLGAGVHYPPPPPPASLYKYPEDERPPLGAALSEYLAKECAYLEKFPKGDVRNLQRVSLCYELSPGRDRQQLVEVIRDKVLVKKKPSPALRALAELPFTLIVTTNFDTLFENALKAAGKNPRVMVYSKDESYKTQDYMDPTVDEPFLYKIHGDIQSPDSIVITEEDYIQFVMRMSDKDPNHPVPETFRFNFKRWPTLFVGYSLVDYNLRLLFKTLRWKLDPVERKQTYSVDPYPDKLILDIWQNKDKQVTFIEQDLWMFVPALYRKVLGREMPL